MNGSAVGTEVRAAASPPRGRVPVIHQGSASDCAAACLAMVLAFHGCWIPLRKLRTQLASGRDGATAAEILASARSHGLQAQALRIDKVDDLARLPPGTILHWRGNHFVVLDRQQRRGRISIVDPAHGRRHVDRDEAASAFSGIALVFEPGAGFERGGQREFGLARFLQPMAAQWPTLARVVAVSLLLQVLALALPVVTGIVVDRAVPNADRQLLWILSVATLVLLAYRWLAQLLREYLLLRLRGVLDSRLTGDFLRHLVGLPFAYFNTRSHGDLAVRLESNALLREILTTTVLSAVLDGLLVLLYVLLLLAGNLQLALLALAFAVARLAVYVVARRRTQELTSDFIRASAETRGYQMHVLRGIETLKASGREDDAVERYARIYRDELDASIAQGRFRARIDAVLLVLGAGGPLLFLLYGAQLVLSGALSLGGLLAMAAVASAFWTPLSGLVAAALSMQQAKSYLERVEDVLSTDPEQAEGAGRTPPVLSGHISVRNVGFAYSPGAASVLDDVSVDIRPGQMVGIVGRSGSGKSTLATLLCGLYAPGRGDIRLDGEDLRELDLRQVRRQMGVVLQKPYLFGTTIGRNIALNDPEADLERIVAAARLAAIHDDIVAMPMGYDTHVSDLGGSLSGGQLQRIAIARALLAQPRILVFDEATSALDALTERKVFDNLRDVNATRIVIAHRLSTIRHADMILVLEAGRLVESGNHEQLLAAGGHYCALLGAQLDDAGVGREGT